MSQFEGLKYTFKATRRTTLRVVRLNYYGIEEKYMIVYMYSKTHKSMIMDNGEGRMREKRERESEGGRGGLIQGAREEQRE